MKGMRAVGPAVLLAALLPCSCGAELPAVVAQPASAAVFADAAKQAPPDEPAATPLAPERARALFSGPGGLPLDVLDELVIAIEEETDDTLSLVLGGTSIVEDTLDDSGLLDPFSEADLETLQ